jgi:hypothetical protein
MTRGHVSIGLLAFGLLLLAGCSRSTTTERTTVAATAQSTAATTQLPPVVATASTPSSTVQTPTATAGLSLTWTAPTTLAIRGDGFTPGRSVLVNVEVSSRSGSGGQTSQQSQQTASTVSVDASGVLTHTLTIAAPAGSTVRVTVTDDAGRARSAMTTVPTR